MGENKKNNIYEQFEYVNCCNSNGNFKFETKMIPSIDNVCKLQLHFPFPSKQH